MGHHTSPFAALTAAEKQIRWLEYQSIRLPYAHGSMDKAADSEKAGGEQTKSAARSLNSQESEPTLPQPPPEIPRIVPDMQRTRHSQYDAIIARLKQAELQSRLVQTSQQI